MPRRNCAIRSLRLNEKIHTPAHLVQGDLLERIETLVDALPALGARPQPVRIHDFHLALALGFPYFHGARLDGHQVRRSVTEILKNTSISSNILLQLIMLERFVPRYIF